MFGGICVGGFSNLCACQLYPPLTALASACNLCFLSPISSCDGNFAPMGIAGRASRHVPPACRCLRHECRGSFVIKDPQSPLRCAVCCTVPCLGCLLCCARNFFLTHMCCVGYRFVDICPCHYRVEDYWHGYKLLCYALYSHSLPHERKFQESKLGASVFSSCRLLSCPVCFALLDFFLECGVCAFEVHALNPGVQVG